MIAGICVLRNAVDLVPYLCGHYLRIGFDRLSFIDDHSTDGTYQLLQKLSEKEPRIRIRLSDRQDFRVDEEMTRLANEAIADGFKTVVPFDADEFWNVTAKEIRALFSEKGEGIAFGNWIHFAQRHRVQEPTRFGVFNIVHRVPLIADAKYDRICAFERPFLCQSLPKVIFRSEGPVSVGIGQHQLNAGPIKVMAQGLEVFHIPLRYASEVVKRANNAPRVTAHRKSEREHWQADHFRDAVAAGRLAEVWAANSADEDGYLKVGGQKFRAVRDTRLRTLLLRAWGFWAARGFFPLTNDNSGSRQSSPSTDARI